QVLHGGIRGVFGPMSGNEDKTIYIMVVTGVRFLNILLAALVAGTIFGIWIGFNPKELSSLAYVEQQQNAIRALNVLMPLLGLVTILITLLSAFLQRKEKSFFMPLLVAA